MFNIPTPVLPDPNRPRYKALPARSFYAASLGKWLELAQLACVPFIGAVKAGELNIEPLLDFEDEKNPVVEAEMVRLDAINQSLEMGEMLRWDCCAGFETKLRMGDGEKPVGQERHLYPGEPRTFDLIYEYPADTIAIWKRPWIEAQQIDGFPVEFRVFVHKGKVAGIANYYLQRDLPQTPEIEALAATCQKYSDAIVRAMVETKCFPAMQGVAEPAELDERAIECSLDFLVTPTGELLLLEGGPGFGLGAHPCAFLEGREVAPIHGLKLASGQPAIALPE